MSHAVKDSDKNKTKKKYVRPEYRVRNDNVQNPQKPNLLCKKSKNAPKNTNTLFALADKASSVKDCRHNMPKQQKY